MTVVVAMLGIAPGAFAGPSPKQDPHIADVVSRVIDAYGGEGALRAEHGYHATGDQVAEQTQTPIRAERWFERPDRLRLDLAYPDHHEIRLIDAAKGWSGSSIETLEPVHSVKLQAMRLQTARLDTPIRLQEHQAEIELRGTDDAGRTVLRLPLDTGLYVDYHIDRETDHIVRVTTGMSGPPSIEFIADYDDFRKVDGVLVPFKEVTYAGDTITSKYQVIRFEWNPKDLDRNVRPRTGESH